MPNDADLRKIIDGARDYAIFSTDPDGVITFWSAGAERTFGYTADEVLGQAAALIFTPEDRAVGHDAREISTAATEGRAEDDRWHVRKDGSRFWASGVLTAIRDDGGTVIGFVKVVRDSTEERRLRETLRLSEEQFARLFISNPAAIAVERRDSESFVIVNEAFLDLVGYWRADILGRSGAALHLWAEPAQRRTALQQLARDGACRSIRLDIRTKSGDVTHCLAASTTTTIGGNECLVTTFVPQ